MANASDKARFHLEQTVPELREWERRKIFTKPEITSITTQRTHHETLLASRESTPTTTLHYYTYESNLSSLLTHRLSRPPHSSIPPKPRIKLNALRSRQLFSLLERGTRRHHGDLGLWSQYLALCEERGAGKRQARVVSQVVRLFPTRGAVWGMAAGWAEGRGDVTGARGFWMRGVRFCGRDWGVRVGWARMEMRWVERSRRTLGLDGNRKALEGVEDGTMGGATQKQIEDEEKDADLIAISASSDEATNNDRTLDTAADSDANANASSAFSSTPAMSGAIPKAIFDSAMKDSKLDPAVAQSFIDMYMEFPTLPCTAQILQHVMSVLSGDDRLQAVRQSVACRLMVLSIKPDSPEFPGAVRVFLKQVKDVLENNGANALANERLACKLLTWIRPMAQDERLVPELKQVLGAMVKRLEKFADASVAVVRIRPS